MAEYHDVIVLGAGAAGLICAFTAAQRGRRVLVLEKSNKAGKKILMSGGGRCNFTNLQVEAGNFISRNSHFCKASLKRYSQWDFLALVQRHDIEYEERKHGQLFCRHSARDILTMLLRECEQAGVRIRLQCEVGQVAADSPEAGGQSGRYRLQVRQGKGPDAAAVLTCESLVVATGALSVPTLGGSGIGYELARQFGLALTPRQAGLVPFMFSDTLKLLCERLSGLSLEIQVDCNGQHFRENLLFTHRGMSGPAMLQISNYWNPGDELSLNLLPELAADQWLLQAKQTQGRSRLKNLLQAHLPRALVTELQPLWWAQSGDTALAEMADKALREIGQKLNDWRVKPSATEGYRTAEVTLGGVDTDGISSRTLEAKNQPGLFFIGEVLDITGHLGGYNFQWAWSSGYSAGLVA